MVDYLGRLDGACFFVVINVHCLQIYISSIQDWECEMTGRETEAGAKKTASCAALGLHATPCHRAPGARVERVQTATLNHSATSRRHCRGEGDPLVSTEDAFAITRICLRARNAADAGSWVKPQPEFLTTLGLL
jgi:hypothetical protein